MARKAFSCGSVFEILNCLGELCLEKTSRNFYKCIGMSRFGEKKQAQLPLRDGSEQTTSLREPRSNGFYGSAPKHPQFHGVRQNTLSSQKKIAREPINFRFLFAIFSTTHDRRIMKLSLMSLKKTSSCVGWY